VATFLPSLRGSSFFRPRYPMPIRNLPREGKALVGDYYQALASSYAWQYGYDRSARTWPVERAVVEGYERVIWVFKAVNIIAGSASRLPFVFYDGPGDDAEMIDDHPLYRVLNRRANPMETGPQFRKRLSSQVLLSKAGAFVELTLSNRNTPIRADLLPPGRTKIVPGRGADLIDHFQVTTIHGTRRAIDPEKVLWFRDPHPIDPYSGSTPLEAAGLSIELDFFARLYNLVFVRNDGRPGGIIGVRSAKGPDVRISDREMERLNDRFGKGPIEAGKLSVVGGDVSYVDLAAKPRDLAYADLAQLVKEQVLSAFGVAESIIANASKSTFSNSGQEWTNFWSVDPMPTHLDIISTGFDLNPDDDLYPGWDTRKVPALQAAIIARREEARTEVEKGLRSRKSYADMAGYGDEIDDTPETRALWVPAGATPIASRAKDKDALSGVTPAAADGQQPGQPPVPGQPDQGGRTAAELVDQHASTEPPAAAKPSATARPAAPPAPPRQRSAADLVAGLESKAHPLAKRRPRRRLVSLKVSPVGSGGEEYVTDSGLQSTTESALSAALGALSTRYVERTVARLQSPKLRKGTRHFTAEHAVDTRVGSAPLDVVRAVDADRWTEEAQLVATPYLVAAAAAAASGLAAWLGTAPVSSAAVGIALQQQQAAASDGGADESSADSTTPPPSVLPDDEDGHPVADAVAVALVVLAILLLLRRSARKQAEALAKTLAAADAAGASIGEIVEHARRWSTQLASWSAGLAVQAATAVVQAATEAEALEAVKRADIAAESVSRTWVSRRDDRVRPTHVKADRQTVGLNGLFVVGQALLRYPGDPLGPVEEVAGCRCRTEIRVAAHRSVVSA
jgi:HK97 family phage portal protein